MYDAHSLPSVSDANGIFLGRPRGLSGIDVLVRCRFSVLYIVDRPCNDASRCLGSSNVRMDTLLFLDNACTRTTDFSVLVGDNFVLLGLFTRERFRLDPTAHSSSGMVST